MLFDYNITERKFKAVNLAVRVGSHSVELSVVIDGKAVRYSELNACKHFADSSLL